MPRRSLQLLVFLLAVWVAALPARAQEEPAEAAGPTSLFGLKEAPVAVRVHPLADGLVREDEWAALRVRLENREGATTVDLALSELDITSGDSFRYTRSVELPRGGAKDVLLYYRPGYGQSERNLDVTIGRKPFQAPFQVHRATAADVLVGVIGDDALGIPVIRDTWTRHVPGSHLRPTSTERRVHTGLIPVTGMPDRPQGYAPLDWVVWSQPDATEASPEALEALLAWVADGGHLLVTTSDTWRSVAGTPLGVALPVALTGVEDVPEIPGLTSHLGGYAGAGPVPVARGQLRARGHTQALYSDARGQPLWAVGGWGLGTIHVLMADPTVEPLASVGRESLWRTLLWLPDADAAWGWPESRRATLHLDPWVLPALRLEAPSPDCIETTGYWSGVHDWGVQVRKVLADIPGVAPLPLSWLLGFSALYLLIIGPVDYFLLKALKRQPWTWITFPVTIALFSAAALIGTSVIKGNQAVVNRVEVVDVLPDAGVWRGASYMGVFATRKSDIRLRAGFDDGIVAPMGGEGGFLRDGQLVSTEGPGSMSWRAETWTLAYVATSWVTPSQGAVRASETPLGWHLVSELAVDLDEVVLVQHGRVYPLPALSAGDSLDIIRGSGEDLATWSGTQRLPVLLLVEFAEPDHGHLDLRGHDGPVLLGVATEAIEPLELRGLNPDSRTTTVMRIPLVVETSGGTP